LAFVHLENRSGYNETTDLKLEMTMKKATLCLGCFLLVLTLAPSLHAETPPAPMAPVDLAAAIFAPAASPAQPGTVKLPDLSIPAPRLTTCTVTECISYCNDCPWGHTNYCADRVACICGCR
jgi:hypothetical protein